MTVIASIDGPNRLIYLHADTVGTDLHPVDIYREMRALRRTDETLRPYDVFISAFGNVDKGGGKATERYMVLNAGTRIVPFDAEQILTITGVIITDDGQEGVACFDRSSLANQVDINYVPPQVEVITVATGSGLDAGQDAKLTRIHSLLDVIEGTMDHQEVMRILLAAMAGKVSGAETTTIRFRDAADSKDRIVANTDVNGNRLAVTLDVG